MIVGIIHILLILGLRCIFIFEINKNIPIQVEVLKLYCAPPFSEDWHVFLKYGDIPRIYNDKICIQVWISRCCNLTYVKNPIVILNVSFQSSALFSFNLMSTYNSEVKWCLHGKVPSVLWWKNVIGDNIHTRCYICSVHFKSATEYTIIMKIPQSFPYSCGGSPWTMKVKHNIRNTYKNDLFLKS